MSESDSQDSDLVSAIASVYGGPLDDFVRRRDALVKELRTAGRRESASIVKNLRKPSRMAWALDVTVRQSQDGVARLAAAVDETLDAQTAGGDVRAAMVRLRLAVRAFADDAAHVAALAGHRIEPGPLANAVLAVLAKPESFRQLRGGYLAEIPEAGGLDFLTAIAISPGPVTQPAPLETRGGSDADVPSHDPAALATSAREAVRQAGRLLADARLLAEVRHRALRDAESALHAAETRLRDAEEEARAARNQRDRTREEAEDAAAQLLVSESVAAEAEQRLNSLLRDDH